MAFPPGTKAAIRAAHLEMTPISGDDAPNGSIYLDADQSDTLSTKSTSGVPDSIVTGEGGGGGGDPDAALKTKQNTSGFTIGAGKIVALLPTGGFRLYDSDDPAGQIAIGVTKASVADSAQTELRLFGANLAGVLTGLGFSPGETVYAGEAPGTYIRLADFTGGDDALVRVGIADCAAGAADSNATDLILFPEIVAAAP